VNDNVAINGHAEVMPAKYRNEYRHKSTQKNIPYTLYDFHGRTTANSTSIEQTTAAAHVPTSILNNQRNPMTRKTSTQTTTQNNHNNNSRRKQNQTTAARLFHSNTNSPTIQQTDLLKIGTPMSGLSPDDSAKTMMTKMSKMDDESIGTVVTKLAIQNAKRNGTMKQANDTMKQMMVQQASTMNNLISIMCRNVE
jgi:hypothetical protein